MIVGFDLDGTLDRPALAELCKRMISDGHDVHIITGVFPEAKDWQDAPAKRRKMERLGIPFYEPATELWKPDKARLYVLDAVPSTFDRNYRLIDLGLRKGAGCEELGITLFYDDSSLYCEMIPKMSGNTLVLKVGEGK
jgi:hypothetical protein